MRSLLIALSVIITLPALAQVPEADRAARGDIPVDNPLFRRVDAFVGRHKVLPETNAEG